MVSTLQRGFGAGWRVSIAPLLTDLPVVAIAVAFGSLQSAGGLNGLAIAGGVVVVLLGGWTIAREREPPQDDEGAGGGDLGRGMLVNLFSPHPWVFWLTVGGPLVVAGWRKAPWRAISFVLGFYALLVGSKLVLAWVVARQRHRLSDRWRRRLVVAGGMLLVVSGAVLIWQGDAGRIG